MANTFLLDSQGRRVLAADGKQQAGNCCYVNAVKCDDGSAAGFYMTTANALPIASFKYPPNTGTCYKFSGAPVPCLPVGAILLTPAQVQTFASCTECLGPSCVQCFICDTGPLICRYRMAVSGVEDCSGQTANVNRSVILAQRTGQDVCTYFDNGFDESGQPLEAQYTLYLQPFVGGKVSRAAGINKPGVPGDLFFSAFAERHTVSRPYDCSQPFSLANDLGTAGFPCGPSGSGHTLGTGGTAAFTPLP